MKTPKPKTVKVVCDVCGLDWTQHKPDANDKITLDECVRLLKVELAKPKPWPVSISGTSFTYPNTSPTIN